MLASYRIRRVTDINGNSTYYPEYNKLIFDFFICSVYNWVGIDNEGLALVSVSTGFRYDTEEEATAAIDKHKARHGTKKITITYID